jgi:alkylhydroperoxidase family enzyme
MSSRYESKVQALRDAVLEGPGELEGAVRKAAAANGEVPAAAAAYVQKVVRHAYKVTDEDVAALLASGMSEDQVFELTVSAAMGAGLLRLDAGMAALKGKR